MGWVRVRVRSRVARVSGYYSFVYYVASGNMYYLCRNTPHFSSTIEKKRNIGSCLALFLAYDGFVCVCERARESHG